MNILAFLIVAAGAPRPTVAVVPPVASEPSESWVGMAIADDLESRLLVHSRYNPATMERIYPLNVFGWRQTLGAARAEGIDTTKPLSDKAATDLARQLGSDATFVGSYTVEGGRLKLRWQLVGAADAAARFLAGSLDNLAKGSEELARQVLAVLGADTTGMLGHTLTPTPLAAVKAYGQALEILGQQSLDPRSRLVLARAQLERAGELLAAATKAAPGFVRAWVGRGLVASMLTDYAKAEEYFVQAMAQAGEFDPEVALALYHFYSRQGKLDQAIGGLEEATTNHLGFLQGLGYLGQAYARAARPHDALRVFSLYTERVPKSPWAQLERAESLSRVGKHDQAIAESQAVAQRFPHSVTVLTALASRQIDAARYEDARATLTRALATHPDHPALLTRLSYVELEQNRADKALALAEKAVSLLGDGRGETMAGYAHVNLAHALALAGRNDEAFGALRKALELGVGSSELVELRRDTRLKSFLSDPRNPLNSGHAAP